MVHELNDGVDHVLQRGLAAPLVLVGFVCEAGDAHFLPLTVESGVVQAPHGWWLARVAGEVQQKVVHPLFIPTLTNTPHRDVQLSDVVLVYVHLDCAVLLQLLHFLLNPLIAIHLSKWELFVSDKCIYETSNFIIKVKVLRNLELLGVKNCCDELSYESDIIDGILE